MIDVEEIITVDEEIFEDPVDDLLEDDEVSAEEDGFMRGYDGDL